MNVDETLSDLGVKVNLGALTLNKVVHVLLLALIGVVVIRVILKLLDGMLARSKSLKSLSRYIHSVAKIAMTVILVLMVAEDMGIHTTSLVAISMPSFWVGLLLMIVFALKLKWLPAGGWSDTLLGQFRCLILPAVTQSLMTSALLLRNTRNSVVDITRMDYVDFARSKGITSGEVRTRHVMRNAMISTVTLLSMRMTAMLGGSVIIETVFSVPGIGKLASDAIFGRDYAVVQYVVLLFAVLVLVINLITDILYSFLDPRVNL